MTRDLRNAIIKHLIDKGNYDPEVDNYVIDMLLENVKYADQMKEELNANGCVVAIPNGNGIVSNRMNPAFGVYQMCLRNIHQCSSKLGINRNDRLKLKILEESYNAEEKQFDRI
jgi:P27 family predicted phage terminase small subunit